MASTPRKAIEFMEPHAEWIDSETVHMLVSGFKREELRVQVTSSGKLKISGERVVDGGRVSRFEKEILIPDDCDVSSITAKYESEILQIRFPKNTTAASVADRKHSHEPQPLHLPQLPNDKSYHETQMHEKHSHETQPQPQLPNDKSTHETRLPEKYSHDTRLPEKHSHDTRLPEKHSHDTRLPEKNSHEAQHQMHLPGDKSSHERDFQKSRTQLPEKHSHESQHQMHLPGDRSSHERDFQEARTQLPNKQRPNDTAAAVAGAGMHNVAQRLREAEATTSYRSRPDSKYDGMRAGQVEIVLETKTKVKIVLTVLGALIVGYLSGRLDQAVRDGWTIVQNRS